MANAFGDNPGLPGACAGDYQQRPVPMGDGAPLRVIHLHSAVIHRRIQIEQRKVHETRLTDLRAKRKRTESSCEGLSAKGESRRVFLVGVATDTPVGGASLALASRVLPCGLDPIGQFRAYAESEAMASRTNDPTITQCQIISKLYLGGGRWQFGGGTGGEAFSGSAGQWH